MNVLFIKTNMSYQFYIIIIAWILKFNIIITQIRSLRFTSVKKIVYKRVKLVSKNDQNSDR